MIKRTFEEWLKLAQAAVRTTTPEKHGAIAQHCLEAEARGEKICVWHASAVVHGTLERCMCGPCEKARGEHVKGRYAAKLWT